MGVGSVARRDGKRESAVACRGPLIWTGGPMPALRFNHMELTLGRGELDAWRDDLKRFYGEVFGFDALDVPILKQTGLLLRTDAETSSSCS